MSAVEHAGLTRHDTIARGVKAVRIGGEPHADEVRKLSPKLEWLTIAVEAM